MASRGTFRKERTHSTGVTNRQKGRSVSDAPLDFDNTTRGHGTSMFGFGLGTHVPLTCRGEGNYDFQPKLPGHDFRQPNADPADTKRLRRETARREAAASATTIGSPSASRTSPLRLTAGPTMVGENTLREAKQKGHKVAPRWNPAKWHHYPTHEQAPLQKEQGEVWNHAESMRAQGEIKGHDRLFRAVRTSRAEDVKTPESGFGHPAYSSDSKEYYPGRNIIDVASEIPGGDFQVRPVHLPDFANPPPPDADPVARMKRIHEVMKQRYAGRMGLMDVFRSCALTKPGFIFPKDLGQIFDQMGIKLTAEETNILVKAVDKDGKKAIAFEEFADLIYGPDVNVGGPEHEAKERYVRKITKTLADSLISNSQQLGQAFCELDPERHFRVDREQFGSALGSACNHISAQAVDFLWASQFPGAEPGSVDHQVIDWRQFMGQLAAFSHDNRVPTPCCVQGRKRQYDMLQRTAPITKGQVPELDLNRPEQDSESQIQLVAGHIMHRSTKLEFPPRQAGLLTENYVEDIRHKAERADKSLHQHIPRARMEALLKNREMVHQDELVELLCTELDMPGQQDAMAAQVPLYAGAPGLTSTAKPSADAGGDPASPAAGGPAGYTAPEDRPHADKSLGGFKGPEGLKLFHADVESYIATQNVNRDHEVKVSDFIAKVYRPEHEKKAIDVVNDGLNRALRKHRPPRERPKHDEEGGEARYDNYWQARLMFEQIADNIAMMEASNGGKLKPSAIFKRVDIDGDGYVTLSDLKTACEKYKVLHTSSDLHAMLSVLDKEDHGCVNIGEFTRNFELHQGSMIDNMTKTMKEVYHEGGTVYRGEDAAPATPTGTPAGGRSFSTPPASSAKSPMLRGAGASIVSSPEQGQGVTMTPTRTPGRVSDVMRTRFSTWKAEKHELWNSPSKTRYGLTHYPDTRHVIEATMPMSHSFMAEDERFKTTNQMHSVFSPIDRERPQVQDDMKKHATGEFRCERIRARQRDFADRAQRAEDAANEFDTMKIARKALSMLSYERKCRASCA
jgi:Ca2+-binding EF-hand superfamily protein